MFGHTALVIHSLNSFSKMNENHSKSTCQHHSESSASYHPLKKTAVGAGQWELVGGSNQVARTTPKHRTLKRLYTCQLRSSLVYLVSLLLDDRVQEHLEVDWRVGPTQVLALVSAGYC